MTHSLYEQQRSMRQTRLAAIRSGVIGIIDIGTSKISALVMEFNPEMLCGDPFGNGVLIAQSAFRIIGAATVQSRGVEAGQITQTFEAERAMRHVLHRAQRMADRRVDYVIACFSGGAPRSYGVVGETSIEGQIVRGTDIGRLLSRCDVPDIGSGREILHATPVNYMLDGKTGLKDPRGQIGEQLGVDMHLMTTDATTIQNIITCIHKCDVEVAGLVSASYAAAISALIENEQQLGAASIDLGGGTSDISVFFRRQMIHTDSTPMGGERISQDISNGLGIPLAHAERLKTLHGGVIATGRDDREMIAIDAGTGDWNHDYRHVSRADLIGIIRPCIAEILETVRDRLDQAGFSELPGQRIVLTGGGSLLPGIDDLATRILGQNVRIGYPVRVRGLPQDMTSPAFSALVGMALYAVYPQDECWDYELPNEKLGERPVRRAINWLRKNW